MFGKPEWFEHKKRAWVLTPRKRQGWAYYGAWAAVILGPLAILTATARVPETLIWLFCSAGAFVYDLTDIRRKIRQALDLENLYYIGEESDSQVSTRNFDLHVRK